MSEFEFRGTKGPWWSEDCGVFSVDHGLVCTCANSPHTETFDARAIAAAPEMIEALDDARDWIDACGAQGGLQGILDKIESALAKATGGSDDV